MTDKDEKVIDGLSALNEAMSKNQCYACSHEFIEVANDFGTNIVANAIELLKEQNRKIESLEIDRDILAKDISFNNCNTCKRNCEHKPRLGEPVRANCFMWEGK